ncbi:cytochrome P450 [Streptomyces chrestomyceticus]|uniref:cytochrome P450 n=1 Tax=Streptomyces chrestomyceticus TaxID=68185 RepID=UPI001BEFDD7C|nr:cytochrome P450 [Streptomyces chrestomyceticus]
MSTPPQAPASGQAAHEEPLPRYPFSTRGDRLAPELDELRGRCPVARVNTNSGEQAWLVTGYELARQVLRDRSFARSVLGEADRPTQDAPILAPELLDAMNHLQQAGLRDEVLKALGRDQPDLPADWVAEITAEGLDTMVRDGSPGDLQRHFADWVAAQCMCRLLGLPFADRDWLAVRADLDLTMVTPTPEELARNWEEIRAYMDAHMSDRRPGEPRGLIDRLADLNATHEGLTRRQLSNIVAVLFVSGYEDFASFLGVAAYNLLQRPEVMSAVRAEPETMPQCVEELLRCSVVLGNAIPRFVTKDAEIGPAQVKEGEMILLSLDAVNYDSAAFPDPKSFTPARTPNPHLRFGYGRHHCPGAHLVRRQSEVAFRVLLDRLPGIRLAVPPAEVPWHPNRMAIMPAEVPVTW